MHLSRKEEVPQSQLRKKGFMICGANFLSSMDLVVMHGGQRRIGLQVIVVPDIVLSCSPMKDKSVWCLQGSS